MIIRFQASSTTTSRRAYGGLNPCFSNNNNLGIATIIESSNISCEFSSAQCFHPKFSDNLRPSFK